MSRTPQPGQGNYLSGLVSGSVITTAVWTEFPGLPAHILASAALAAWLVWVAPGQVKTIVARIRAHTNRDRLGVPDQNGDGHG